MMGVRTAVVCAGARNAPLLKVFFRSKGIDVCAFIDERSAAFFALGRAKATGAPAAVVTTSGTAAAELLPAAIEAYYSCIPLVLVTADRPPPYRGTGAPQTIDQVGLFGPYVARCIDVIDDSVDLGDPSEMPHLPIHLNVCFDEPLLDGEIVGSGFIPGRAPFNTTNTRRGIKPRPTMGIETEALNRFFERATAPLAILGELPLGGQDSMTAFLKHLGAPVYAESLSQLRGVSDLSHLCITSGERYVKKIAQAREIDGVLRLGGVPTLRTWRDLDGALSHLPVLSMSHRPFTGLARTADAALCSLTDIDAAPTPHLQWPRLERLLGQDRKLSKDLSGLLDDHPRAEPPLVRDFSRRLPGGSLVYLGNSLPIRHWDLVADPRAPLARVAANRGANGIDGQIATFLGMCAPGRANIALFGDLTTLYDTSGLWALRCLDPDIHLVIAVINNHGGRIFGRIFEEEQFQTPHELGFEHIAKQWSLDYEKLTAIPPKLDFSGRTLIEILPCAKQTAAFDAAYEALWQDA